MYYDVIIIGGGPAGLSAALVLGRCKRNILICDSGKPRNFKSHSLNGYLSRDGIEPIEFLRIGRGELKKYGVQLEIMEIVKARFNGKRFEIFNRGGSRYFAKKVLIATGVKDNLPDIPGFEELYGKSIFHCPYCDGWEVKDNTIAVYGKGRAAYDLSFSLKTWTDDIIICSDGPSRLNHHQKEILSGAGIDIYEDKITSFEPEGDRLKRICFADNSTIERDVIFFTTGHSQHSEIFKQLGCSSSSKGYILFDKKQKTSIKGVFTAGDCTMDMKFVVVAAAEGAKAAVAINKELQQEELFEKYGYEA